MPRLAGRLPGQIENTAYFVVAEALTNVAKHSGATGAERDRAPATAACSRSRSATTATAGPTPAAAPA